MKSAILCGIAAAALCAATAPALAAPTVDAFAADIDYGPPSLSPDGTKLVYVGRAQGKRVVFLLDLVKKQRQMPLEARFDKYEVTRCDFKNDERLLCRLWGMDFFHGQAFKVTRLVSVDLTGQEKPKVLIQKTDYALSQFQDRIVDWQRNDPKSVLIELNQMDQGPFPNVFALDVYTGLLDRRPLVPARDPISSWYSDRNGAVRFGEGYDDRGSVYVARARAVEAGRDRIQFRGFWLIAHHRADFREQQRPRGDLRTRSRQGRAPALVCTPRS